MKNSDLMLLPSNFSNLHFAYSIRQMKMLFAVIRMMQSYLIECQSKEVTIAQTALFREKIHQLKDEPDYIYFKMSLKDLHTGYSHNREMRQEIRSMQDIPVMLYDESRQEIVNYQCLFEVIMPSNKYNTDFSIRMTKDCLKHVFSMEKLAGTITESDFYKLESKYSMHWYFLLCSMSDSQKSICFTFHELKIFMGMRTTDYNKNPRCFIRRVLEEPKLELEKKTSCSFIYLVNRVGRAGEGDSYTILKKKSHFIK